jgi:hypothetical protein
MFENQLFYAYIGSNLVALVMVALSWRWKAAARLSFVLLFLVAGIYNFATAFARPGEYVSFIRLENGSYALRFFLQHPAAIVASIGIGQLVIAVLVSLRNWPVTLGLLGATLFLLGIAPLGTAAGFPASLVMAIAALLLLRTSYASTLWSQLVGVWHHPHAHSAS